jgi:ribosome-binding protein aMBF1 (putative translation factor)
MAKRPRIPGAILDKHIGSRVRARRTMLGKSEERLAQALSVSVQCVKDYENGKLPRSSPRAYTS